GTATMTGGPTSFDVVSSYSLVHVTTLAPLSPVLWIALEARDAQGNLARHRAIVADQTIGTPLGSWPTPGIPTVTPPGGPVTGSPTVTFEDRLVAAVIPGGFAVAEVVAIDPNGRTWSVLREDRDGPVGSTTWQLPDLSGTGAVGLAPGTWQVRAQAHLAFSVTATPGDFLLEELRRGQVTFARSAAVDFVVQ